jgi:16S rRNA (cytosine967-C5)-methyltransferase
MTKLAPARRAALAVLSDTRRRDGRIRDIIRTHPAFSQLSAADSALATRLAVGATAARDLLDELLLARVRKPSSLEPRVLDALRISAFELLYLETPSEVAVSQGVELVRSASPRAAGMANAVLRKVAEIEVDDGDLRMVSGLPAWLIGRIAEDDGPDAADRLARCNLEPAPVYVFSEHADALAPFSPTATDLDRVYELRKPAGFFSSGLVQYGTVVVSDLAAQHVCAAVAELAGADLLEIGQGSGTKTLIIAQRCDARIAAVDVLPSKVASAQARISRAGLGSRVRSFAFDGTELGGSELPEELGRTFGCVFLDAPCSGTGTMRRHPEIASSLTAEGVSDLARLQAKLLAAASSRVAPGGHLVYSTCSVLAEENRCVVDAFLASEAGRAFSRVRDDMQTIPASGSCDGHFCAVLKRD